ncbi:hypothetical protein SOCE26_003200 [Sorangium cellulosum]|uniref:Dienelactone hydrolase domain-containing protein n=1 Tax=Sorangium cellulosum TaxID=56 RepID=A0A2L0EI17_SORCE|nr:alpha/beta hydrolase [Sorangium cellulosum]AUX38939.1 hypothetical protein SOCE26_003200 [Sorangium cellulosum]
MTDQQQPGSHPLRLETQAGEVNARLHPCAGDTAVLWVFGAGGGLGGPAGGIYDRLAEQLRPEGLASLELDYRYPGRLAPCVADVLTGITYLQTLGKRRIVLVGHSFGGAVVIGAAVQSPAVIAVAALSSQTAGTSQVAQVSPRPILFVHGEADEVLPARGSLDLHARAREPKELLLYPGSRHGLDQCRDALDRDLSGWLRRVTATG